MDNTPKKHAGEKAVDQRTKAQHQCAKAFDPFFTALHEGVKQLDKTVPPARKKRRPKKRKLMESAAQPTAGPKRSKTALEALHKEVRMPKSLPAHPLVCKERFPTAEYERRDRPVPNSPARRK